MQKQAGKSGEVDVTRPAEWTPGRVSRWLMVAVLVVLALLRLYNLGTMDTRSDEVWVLQYLQQGHGTADMAVFCLNEFKPGRQMPLSRMTNAVLQDLLRWPVTLFTIRLPYAVMGMLTILALYQLGKALGGDTRLGWVLAWMGAINPYLFHWSKVAHNYTFAMCLFTFAVAAFCVVFREGRESDRYRRGAVTWFATASILACYAHMANWPGVALLWVAWAGDMVRRRERRSAAWKPFAAGVVALGLSLLPWIALFISAVFTAKETFIPANTDIATQWKQLSFLPEAMTWGGGWRVVVSWGLPVAAVVLGVWRRKLRWTTAGVAGGTLVTFLLLLGMQYYASENFAAVRYYSPVWTGLILLSGVGLVRLADALVRLPLLRRPGAGWLTLSLCVLMGAAMANPVRWTVTLPAPSIPYTMINRWMDQHLPKGSPVLVDRWLEPWNEMRTHAPSNVVVTFTIPNEPVEVFKKYQWRETAKQFLTRYPDAAYLEIVKQWFLVPEIGWWDWPRLYFRRRVVFTNEQALALARLNLMPSPAATMPGANTNRIISELFYNTPADVVQIAREEGRKTVLFYASGWGYTKLWPQIQDFRDWRVAVGTVGVDIYNLTDAKLSVKLKLRAVAVGASKSVRIGDGAPLVFAQGQVLEIDSQPLDLQTGRNSIAVSVSGGEKAGSALLVEEIAVVEAQQ